MQIRNMSVTKHHDTQTLELWIEAPACKLYSVFIPKPLDSEHLPAILEKAGIQLRNLIREGEQNGGV